MNFYGFTNFSSYARQMLLFPSASIVKIDTVNLEELRKEINRIGNNINQLAKIANQSKSIDQNLISNLNKQFDELKSKLKNDFEIKVKEIKSIYGSH